MILTCRCDARLCFRAVRQPPDVASAFGWSRSGAHGAWRCERCAGELFSTVLEPSRASPMTAQLRDKLGIAPGARARGARDSFTPAPRTSPPAAAALATRA